LEELDVREAANAASLFFPNAPKKAANAVHLSSFFYTHDAGTMANTNDNDNVYIHCSAGYRSVIASSLLNRQGIHNLHNVAGGGVKLRN